MIGVRNLNPHFGGKRVCRPERGNPATNQSISTFNKILTSHFNTMASKMTPMPIGKYSFLVALISAQSLFGGYWAATRPEGAGWRYFSWHPMLMMVGAFA